MSHVPAKARLSYSDNQFAESTRPRGDNPDANEHSSPYRPGTPPLTTDRPIMKRVTEPPNDFSNATQSHRCGP